MNKNLSYLIIIVVLLWSASVNAFNGGGLLPTHSLKKMPHNIEDENVFKNSSVLNSFQVDRANILNGPKDYLIPLREGNLDYNFVLTKENRSENINIFSYAQLYKNLPIFGGDLNVRVSVKEGSVILTGYFFKNIKTIINPVHKVPALVKKAQKILGGGTLEGEQELGILPGDKRFYLSQKIKINKGPLEQYVLYMDAITGNILKMYNDVYSTR
jgi:Zn-dependent metalloprotease